ncbi:class I adenylate-forming enzyme family protein [Microcella sp.]|uniref:class I adenylate-forming enzyme family protein n=1 Tax=Microcella sp. TaxID=1913979 RepID=UPI0025679261|nr:class I adenylate-forming enzyme family protein [Microcella sp.]MBX9473045.1 acyl--CoA ligase [Microcella sp.]
MVTSIVSLPARHAAERPGELALVSIDRAWTFAELDAAVAGIAARLHEAGVRPRNVVATDLPAALDWLVGLALLRLASRGLSLNGMTTAPSTAVDVLVTRPGARLVPSSLVVEVDEFWVAGGLERASEAPMFAYARPDSICRLILTSGTTGAPRAAALTVQAVEHRLAHLHHYWSDERRELELMSLSTTGGFHSALAALQHGVPYLAVDHINAASLRLAAEHGVRVLCGSPVHLGTALRVLAEHDIALPTLDEVRVAGAAASDSLLRAIEQQLGVPVRGVYGSTEGGGAAMRMLASGDDAAAVGAPLPGVELQIVDDADKPVAAGVDGFVRYRGRGLAAGYLEHGELVEGDVHGGWFYPGDTGTLRDGQLELGGRKSEVLNLGGTKVDPERIDEIAREFVGVRDAAAYPIERRPGIVEIGLAVVAEPHCDLRALDAHLRKVLPGRFPTVFGRVAEVPRNRMGKVQRHLLTTEFARRFAVPDAPR